MPVIGSRNSAAEIDRLSWPTDEECLHWLWTLRYAANGSDAFCARCGRVRKFHKLRSRRAYACDVCGLHIHPTAGTFLGASKLGLATWYRAVVLVLRSSGRMSAKHLAAELAVSYQTALRVKKKLLRVTAVDGGDADLLAKIGSAGLGVPDGAAKWHGGPSSRSAEKIRVAACKAFTERGLAGTRVSDIAKEAGVSPASIHYYFGSKERVLLAALEWSTEQNMGRLHRIDQQTRDPLRTLLAVLSMALSGGGMPEDDGPLWLEAYVNVRHRPELLEICEGASSEWTDFLVEVIGEGERRGVFRPIAPAREIALGLTAMLDGLSFKSIAGFQHLDLAVATTIVLRFLAQQLGIPLTRLTAAMHSAMPVVAGRET